MGKKRRLYFAILFILYVLTSCQEESFHLLNDGSNQIFFSVGISEQFSHSQIHVKGTPQDQDAYFTAKINVLGYDQSSTSDRRDFETVISSVDNGLNWTSDPTPYYDGRTYNLYSYASDLKEITSSFNENGLKISNTSEEPPILHYKVPQDAEKQPDLIIGEKIEGKKQGKVELNMNHALTCIGFYASSHIQGRKVRRITLRNVYGEGSFQLGSDPTIYSSWTLHGSADQNYQPVILEEEVLGDDETSLTDIMQGDGYLMMLPQKLKEGAEIEVVVWDGADPESESQLIYQLPPTIWHPGKKYMYYFDEPPFEGVAAYYEMYEDRTVGLYYYDSSGLQDLLKTDPNNEIVDAGYGVLVPAGVWTRFPNTPLEIALGNNGYTQSGPVYIDGCIVATVNNFGTTPTDCVLYPMSQNRFPYNHIPELDRGKGITPSNTNVPLKIKARMQGNVLTEIHGYCLPHFARGIYGVNTAVKVHSIRTPIQMRNISYQTAKNEETQLENNSTIGNEYIQEPSVLDFTIKEEHSIYGVDVNVETLFYESIVKGVFNGAFAGKKRYNMSERLKATIGGLIIKAKTPQRYIALFDVVGYGGSVSDVDLKPNCSIVNDAIGVNDTASYTGGFVGFNYGSLIRLTNYASLSNIQPSRLYMGGIVGLNSSIVEECENGGTLSNLSISDDSRVGGIAGVNEKAQKWNSLSVENKNLMINRVFWTDLTSTQQLNWEGAKILSCINRGKIYGTTEIGGIAGYNNYAGIVYKCLNSGAVVRRISASTKESYVGGVVGLQQTGEYNPAQFNPQVIECTNSGNISDLNTSGKQVGSFGGIVGNNDWNHQATLKYPNATAFGRVYRCYNTGNIQGYGAGKSGIGGIAGINNGTVKQCQSSGTISGSGKTNIGGIVGFNTYYVGDCLYHNSSDYVSIVSNTPGAITGGIVGFNALASAQLDPTEKYSDSGYITRCLFLARSPQSLPTGSSIGGLSPIAGLTTYLYRKTDGTPNLSVDGTTGATPYYTIENSYFLSGENYNTVNAISSIYEPEKEDVVLGPFIHKRYPLGMNPLSTNYFGILPLMQFWQLNGWYKTGTYPFVVENPSSLTQVVNPSGTAYLAYNIVNAIKSNNTSTNVSITPTGAILNNTCRIDLLNLGTDLGTLNRITIDLSGVTLNVAPESSSAGIFIKAPRDWNMTISGGAVYGTKSSGLYCYIHRANIASAHTITLTR